RPRVGSRTSTSTIFLKPPFGRTALGAVMPVAFVIKAARSFGISPQTGISRAVRPVGCWRRCRCLPAEAGVSGAGGYSLPETQAPAVHLEAAARAAGRGRRRDGATTQRCDGATVRRRGVRAQS